MSRIGKNPVVIPEKVEVKVEGAFVSVKGPKGQLEYTFTNNVTIALVDKTVTITPVGESKLARSLWGTTRTLINNMVVGVSTGFTKALEFNGVGYKASVKGSSIELNLGFSHPIIYRLPEGISAKVTRNVIDLSGSDKALLGFCAAKIRSFRPPEPYKGKGVKYSGEVIIRKAGKTGGK
jgi:large subunit ribosomal protein L6